MAQILISPTVEFEVYLLMTMKPRLSLADMQGLLDAKLAGVGLSTNGAQRIHDRIAVSLSNETSRFREMKALLGFDKNAASLNYSSVLWPGFEFKARADPSGLLLELAGYMRTNGATIDVESPTQLAAWSVDIAEFADHFGPVDQHGKTPLFDDILPAYEELEFLWSGDRYGAGFLWGIFLTSSAYWE